MIQQLNWNDGFNDDVPARFSRKRFGDKLKVSEPMLMHLHGSIRYGFDTRGRIAKYGDAQAALASFAHESAAKPNQAGEVGSPGPIISGLRKLDKLASTPYGYFYSAFINSIITYPRLLIIGYGFHDAHLDYWLGQHKTIHGANRRVVVIKKDTTRIKSIRRDFASRAEAFKELMGQMWRKAAVETTVWKSAPGLSFLKDLEGLLILSGSPPNATALSLILEHLTS